MSRRASLTIALGLAALGLPTAAGAETGWVDASMGGRPVTVDLGPGADVAAALAVQPDGKVVVAGSAEAWNGFQVLSQMAVARLDPSGRPDPAFNGGELLVLGHRTAMSSGAAVALQPDGKIGDGSTIDRQLPVTIGGSATLSVLGAGAYHSLAA